MTKLVRVEETAKQLGISRTVVFGLMRDGELLSVKIGRARRVPQAAIDDYVERLLIVQNSVEGGERSDTTEWSPQIR